MAVGDNSVDGLSEQVYSALARLRYGRQQSTADTLDVWKPTSPYVAGDKVFPTAYRVASTWDSGFVAAGGGLYCLVCITGGTSAATEPVWANPVTITNYSWGQTSLNVVDGGVTWRIRRAVFIDPTAATNGTGSHLSPYQTWVNEVGNPATGIISTDPAEPAANTNTGAQYAGAVFLQRANTTATSALRIDLCGPQISAPNDHSWYTQPTTTTWAERRPRYLTYGAYRKPFDAPVRPKIIRTGATGGAAAGAIYGDKKQSHQICDLDISNQMTGGNAHGVLRYYIIGGSGDAGMVMRRCVMRDCLGSGSIFATYAGTSLTVGANGVQYYDCEFNDNSGFGASAQGNFEAPLTSFTQDDDGTIRRHSIRYVRCSARRNGKQDNPVANHHGFSSISVRRAYGTGNTGGNTGWTLVSGNIYSRADLAPSDGTLTTVDDVVSAIYRSNGGVNPAYLKRNTLTPTTPGTGEYGYVSPTLYVNLGAVMDSRTQFSLQFAKCKDILYDSCEASYTASFYVAGVQSEGWGFCADEFSSVSAINCLAYKNERGGIFYHYGSGSEVSGSIVAHNGQFGVNTSCSLNTRINGNVIIDNEYAIANLFGAIQTNITDNRIISCKYGIRTEVIYTAPYPVPSYPLLPGFSGSGNSYEGVSIRYIQGSPSTSFTVLTDLPGDITVQKQNLQWQ